MGASCSLGGSRPCSRSGVVELELVLALALALLPAAARAGDEPQEEPLEKPKLTSAELEERLDKTKLTVDWNGAGVLDALNEVQQKSGLRFEFDQALADFASGRKVSYDGYATSARDALKVLSKAGGFAVEPDPERGVFRLKMDPAFPTRVALEEKKLSVEWKDTSVSRAIQEIEKKTGLTIELHETMKSRLRSRKITWDAAEVTAREALETLYVYPPPSVPGRIDVAKGMKVTLVYAGPPETKQDVEFLLDDRRVTASYRDAPLADLAKFVAETAKLKCDVEPKLAKEGPKVTVEGGDVPLRELLDAAARSAGATWKIEGSKPPGIVFRAATSSRAP